MNKQTARKIAYRRAWLILQSTLESGWDPNEGGSHEYSKVECRKILKEVENICDFLWKKSKGNPEQNLIYNRAMENEDEESWQQEIIEAAENIEIGHCVDGPCACPRCVEAYLGKDNME
jgi:hypothetical protein